MWSTSAGTVLPRFASGDLVSVGRDRRWLAAIQVFSYAYQQTERLDTLGASGYELLLQGQARLRPLTQDPDPARASQAYDLLSVLVFRQAYPGSGVDASLVGDGVIDLQNAVRLDPQNELAKENLELALRVASATHNVGIVAEACDRVAVMYAGKIVEDGPARDVFVEPAHPYTRELLRSTISLETIELHSIPGAPPNLIDPPSGCRFHPRCPDAMRVCAWKQPLDVHTDADRRVQCWLHGPESEIPPGEGVDLEREELAVADEA